MDYDEDDKMMDEDEETQDIPIQIERPETSNGDSLLRRTPSSRSSNFGEEKRRAKSRLEQPLAPLPQMNPYLKKAYHHEVELCDMS